MNRTLRTIGALLALLLPPILALPAGSCGVPRAQEAHAAPAPPSIPALKPRPAGLAAAEFAAITKKYAALRERIVKNTGDKEAYVALAQLFMAEARVTGDHPYYYPAAERMLDAALTVDASFIPALISKGSVLLSLHRFAEARAVAEQARAVAPNLGVVYGILCDANVELGDYKAAVAATDMMISIRPDLRSYSRVSYLREIHGDDSGAISAMRLAVEAGPAGTEETEWARATLANLYLRTGNLAGAEREYRMSLAARPGYPFALGGLARVRAAQGRVDDALRLLDSASAAMPEFSFVQLKADLYRARGDARRADSLVTVVETMLKSDEAAGHNVDKEYALLWAEQRMKPELAVERARKELARRPDNIEAEHAMALALFRAGKVDEASTLMARALRLRTADPTMLTHAAMIDAALGKSGAKVALKRELASGAYLPPLTRDEARTLAASL